MERKLVDLRKYKVFTLEDMRMAYDKGRYSDKVTKNGKDIEFNSFIQSLQPPTEIEVEIEVTKSDDIKSVEKDWYKIGEPKLDENGCLILKRI
jgi:hypothetical protein